MARSEAGGGGSTRRTVLIAGGANVFVAVVKLAAGLLTGSSAMLAEAAHSVADTLNQAFLLTSVHRANAPPTSGTRSATARSATSGRCWPPSASSSPGAGFSVFEGLLAAPPREAATRHVAYIALGVAAIAEGTSLVRAYSPDPRRGPAAAHRADRRTCRASPDTTVKAALFEDSAAVVGLVLAAAGLVLRQLTGSAVWDGGASIAIGVLLVVVAVGSASTAGTC